MTRISQAQIDALLVVGQGLWGLVSPKLDGVAVDVDDDGDITIWFAYLTVDDEAREDVDDVISEVEGLMIPDTPYVRAVIHVGSAYGDWEGRQHILVFLAKPRGDSYSSE